jgi:hypothetical protein
MLKFVDNVFKYFGYTKAGLTDIKADKREIPANSNIHPDEDAFGENLIGDYWSGRVKDALKVDDTDINRYIEVDLMDLEVPEISTALDVNADYIVYPNENNKNKTVNITSTNAKAQNKIDEIESRISVQQQLFPMIRGMLKYGDNAEEIVTNVDRNLVLGFRNIPIKTVVPVMIDGFPNHDPRIVQHICGKKVAEFKAEEVFHLSLNTDRGRYCRYGKGVPMLEKSRLLYRQVKLMEEGVMISRLSRANQNYAIIVDVGDLQGEDALSFLDQYRKRVTRRKYVDSRTGKWAWNYNPLSVIEDIMVPTRAGSGGNVVALNNNNATGKNIEDIMYFQDKLIYSTGTPKILIGKEVDTNSKSTSDNQMIVFLRRIRRIQSSITPAIKELYKNMLAIEGVYVTLDELNVQWPSSMTIDEERNMIIEKLKAEIAKILRVDIGCVDDFFIYTKILGMSDIEAEALKDRVDAQKEDDLFYNSNKFKSQNTPDEEEPADTPNATKPTKEELVNIIRAKLNDDQFKEWERMQDIIKANPILAECVVDLINVLQAGDYN